MSPATLVKASLQRAQSLICNPFCSCLSFSLVSLAPEVNVTDGELVGKSTTLIRWELAILSSILPDFVFWVCVPLLNLKAVGVGNVRRETG